MENETNQDRRKAERFQSLNLLTYCERDDADQIIAQGIAKTIDISESGALIEIPLMFSNIERVTFELALQEEIVPLEAEIIEQTKVSQSIHRVRVKFRNMRPSIWHRLATFLRDL